MGSEVTGWLDSGEILDEKLPAVVGRGVVHGAADPLIGIVDVLAQKIRDRDIDVSHRREHAKERSTLARVLRGAHSLLDSLGPEELESVDGARDIDREIER